MHPAFEQVSILDGGSEGRGRNEDEFERKQYRKWDKNRWKAPVAVVKNCRIVHLPFSITARSPKDNQTKRIIELGEFNIH